MIAKYLFFLILFMVILIHASELGHASLPPRVRGRSDGGVCLLVCSWLESVRPRIRTFLSCPRRGSSLLDRSCLQGYVPCFE